MNRPFRFLYRNLFTGVIVAILGWIIVPFWHKPVDAYKDFAEWSAGIPELGHIPTWVLAFTAVFFAGLIGNILWWIVIYVRFRNFVEVKYYPNKDDTDVFDLGLSNGKYIEKDGTVSDICYTYIDYLTPKGIPHFARAGSGRIVPTGRTAKKYTVSNAMYWFGIHCPHEHGCDCKKKYG